MKAVVTRVLSGGVSVAGEIVGQITQPGLLVLVAVTHTDSPEVAEKMAVKIRGLRILRNELSVADTGAPNLLGSQLTLYGETTKGRRPSWAAAAPGEIAQPLVDHLVNMLRHNGSEVVTGRFGADMAVSSVNDGPFTVLLEI